MVHDFMTETLYACVMTKALYACIMTKTLYACVMTKALHACVLTKALHACVKTKALYARTRMLLVRPTAAAARRVVMWHTMAHAQGGDVERHGTRACR